MTDPCPAARTTGAMTSLYAALLVLWGGAVATGGAWLAWLGGSPFFLASGAGFAIVGVLVWRRHRGSALLYLVVLAATWIWALTEAGFDLWRLTGRLGVPLLLGVGFLLPALWRNFEKGPRLAKGTGIVAAVMFAVVSLSLVIGLSRDPAETDPNETHVRVPMAVDGASIPGEWRHYGGDQGGMRYSPLDEINRSTVERLAVAWTYRTGDYPPGEGGTRRLEVTPIHVNGLLYLCTSASKVIALDGETGNEQWVFDPQVDLAQVDSSVACRGVAYSQLSSVDADTHCSARIYTATVDARLIAIDARSGERCRDFGEDGQVDLTAGLGDVIKGYVSVSSAPIVAGGKVIVGGRVSDGQFVGEPGAPIRAFDAQSGKFAWAFDPGNPTDQSFPQGDRHFTRGTPNSWAPMSVDEELGLLFVPTGNATPDYWGGHRTALDDRYSSAVIALDIATGKERWAFQTTHHDLWDADVGSQPTLVDVPVEGRMVRAVLQPTKRGQIFLLEASTGRPLAEVKERTVPQGGVPGERLSPTQPFSTGMPMLDGLPLSESDMWGLTPLDDLWCRIRYRQARWDGTLTPPTLGSYIQMPSGLGGVNWGGATVDPGRRMAFIAWSRLPMLNRLVDRKEADRMGLAPIGPGGVVGGAVPQMGTPFAAIAEPFSSPLGVPCGAPPYGLFSAIDLDSRQIAWTRRLGDASNNRVAGIRMALPVSMGTPLSGGSLATGGDLVFIGAVGDNHLRAFDADTGKTIWSSRLPAAANATPMTYQAVQTRRQIVVVAAGGHPMIGTTPGDYIIGFALER